MGIEEIMLMSCKFELDDNTRMYQLKILLVCISQQISGQVPSQEQMHEAEECLMFRLFEIFI